MPKQSLPTMPPDADANGKEDQKVASLLSIVNGDGANGTLNDSAPANSAAAPASSTSMRTRDAEGPEVHPPLEPASAHSNAKNLPKGTSDVARPHQAPDDNLLQFQETENADTRLGRSISIRTIEMSYANGSQSVVTATTDAAAREVTAVATNHPSQIDSEEDEAINPPSNSASAPEDSRIGGCATPEVYPPTPRQAPSEDIQSKSRLERKSAKPAAGKVGAWPEEAPVEDPCDRQGLEDQRSELHTRKKIKSRAPDGSSDKNTARNRTVDSPASSSETQQNAPDMFVDEPTQDHCLIARPASQATPGAIAISSDNLDRDSIENNDFSRLDQGTDPVNDSDVETAVEALAGPQEEILSAPIEAHIVNERGARMRTAGTARVEQLARRLAANAPLIDADAASADPMPWKCSPREFSRRTWAILALLLAITAAAAALMGVLIPRGSTTDSKERTQNGQEDQVCQTCAPSALIPTLLPSSAPTVDPDAIRFKTIWSILVPISGAEVLLNVTSPQYRALEWVSFVDSLLLPYDTEANRKRIIQRFVLATLYYSTGGEHWVSSFHFLEGLHECDWWSIAKSNKYDFKEEGVFCSKGKEAGVDFVHMFSNNMTGTLPLELQQLSDMFVLAAYDNRLGGPIPRFIANMTSLEALLLQGNELTGTIPESIGDLRFVQNLLLNDNKLNGSIPSEMGKLTSVVWFWLSSNQLTGTIPVSFGDLTSLEHFFLFHNNLNGALPSELGQLTRLVTLSFMGNQLTNTIPESFGDLTSLEHFLLFDNELNGTIPSKIGQLTSLVTFSLFSNQLTGTIPESFSNLTRLENFHLFDNELNGTIPSKMGQLTSLVHLDHSANKLTGTIPKLLVNLTSLVYLYLNDNDLNGTIPSELARLTRLERLLLMRNGFTGSIPHELCLQKESGLLDLVVDRLTANGSNFVCECVPIQDLLGCCVVRPDGIGDGSCDPYEPYYTDACNYDNGDCPLCPEGTFPATGKHVLECCVEDAGYIGDGWCDGEPYNTESCGWDGGDCCKETCKDSPWTCGSNGYDCKDPTTSDKH